MNKLVALVIRAAIVLLIVSWSLQAIGQADPNYGQRAVYASKYYKFKKMKSIGLVMTVGGGLLAVVGINKLVHAPQTTNSSGQTVYTGSDATTGAVMYVCAIPLIGAGIPLSIVGGVKSKKYRRLMESTSMSGSMMPHNAGIKLTWKF